MDVTSVFTLNYFLLRGKKLVSVHMFDILGVIVMDKYTVVKAECNVKTLIEAGNHIYCNEGV